MATFKCLTNLLFVLLCVNGLLAWVDDEDDDNPGESAKPPVVPYNFGDTIVDDTKPGEPKNNPSTPGTQENVDQQAETKPGDNIGNKPSPDNNSGNNAAEPGEDKNEEGGFGSEEKEDKDPNENVDLGAAGIKHRFLESEEVEEEEKVQVKPPGDTGQKNENSGANTQNSGLGQQFSYFSQQDYITNQVNLMFNNDPNNIPLIISYAHQGDIDHELLVLKALKKLLKDLKNFDIIGKIAVIQYLENHVLVKRGITPNQRSDGELLKRQFYKMVYDQMTEEIKTAIVNRIPLNTPRYVLNSKAVLEHNEEFCRKILFRSIRELYNETAERLKDLIDGVNTLPYVTQSIHGFRAIFNQFETKNEWNQRYKDVYLLAKALQNQEISPNFYRVSVAARNSFYYMKENLPFSVKNLIWARNHVCFKNLDTWKYLYPANMTNLPQSPVISTKNSLFLIKPVPQEGIWYLKEKKESFRIINLYYQRSISADKEEDLNEEGEKKYPNKYEIIPQDDAVLIKNLKTNKYLKDVGANLPPINKVEPVNSQAIDDKFLWVIEDCGYQMWPGGYYGVMPFNFGNGYFYK